MNLKRQSMKHMKVKVDEMIIHESPDTPPLLYNVMDAHWLPFEGPLFIQAIL
jgi:hypothetical protein